MKKLSIVLILVFVICSTTGYAQPVYYVTQTGAGNKSGNSWNNAFGNSEFILALKIASYGTEFHIAAGTYYPENNRDSSFIIRSGVKLYGGFPNAGNPGFNDRNWNTNPVIFSGDLNKDDFSTLSGTQLLTHFSRLDNCNHVIKLQSTDTLSIIDGISIINGNAVNTNDFYGGAVKADSCSAVFVNCSFSLNSAGFGGGAISRSGNGTLKLLDCSFTRNFAERGGAVYSNRALTFLNCSFLDNSTKSNGWGGATFITDSCKFDSCIFKDNKSQSSSEACHNSTGTYNSCIFSNNNNYLFGLAYIKACRFESSTIQFEVSSINDTLTLEDCSFSGGRILHNYGSGNPPFMIKACSFKNMPTVFLNKGTIRATGSCGLTGLWRHDATKSGIKQIDLIINKFGSP